MAIVAPLSTADHDVEPRTGATSVSFRKPNYDPEQPDPEKTDENRTTCRPPQRDELSELAESAR
jgi:hypothetical protein